MKAIGYTKSEKPIFYMRLEEWDEVNNKKGIILADDDFFDAHCMFLHITIWGKRNNDSSFEEAYEYAIEYYNYLVDNFLWEKLLKRWEIASPLGLQKRGKELAIFKFQ
jgi:hypothetical protein